MPIPNPEPDESKDDFVSRCISAISDEYDSDQAAGICYSQWDGSKKSNDSSDTTVKTETPKNLGEPKSDAERAKEHFNISDEEWESMSPDERQAKIDKLPPRGEGLKSSDKPVNTVNFIYKSEDEGFYIGGYGNVYMLDENGEIVPDFDDDVITLEALDEGIKTMMRDPSRRNHMYYHTNIQIGEILEEYVDGDGVTWKTHVVFETSEQYPKLGLFIVCKLFLDNPLASDISETMKNGEMLAFSVGGIPLEEKKVCDDDKCWNEISKFYLAEVSSCSRGINAESKGFILKLDKNTQIYYSSVDNNHNGYISETMKKDIDDVELSINDSEPNINSDIDGELNVESEKEEENTLDETQDVIEEQPCECPEEEEETPVEKEIPEPEPEVEEEEEVIEKSDEPRREDFNTYAEFAKAVADYNEKLKEQTPATEKQLEALRKELAELKKSLEDKTSDEYFGEVVRKSVAVKKADPVKIDYESKKKFLGVA